MRLLRLILGDLQTNCYLVADDNGNGAVIDPGYAAEAVLEAAKTAGITIRAVLLTHGHYDHVGGVRGIAEALQCPVWIHENELKMPAFMTAGKLYYTDTYREAVPISVGELTIRVMETPGHSPGSVCLQCGELLFTGDTLFAGSIGRTDLPCGDWELLRSSLKRLREIPEDYTVLPGHGGESRLSTEQRTNPYMKL